MIPAPTQAICNPSVWFLLVLQWSTGQSIIAQLYDQLKRSIKHFILRVLGGLYLDFYDISCRWFMRCFIMCLMSSINNRRTASDLRNILFNLEPAWRDDHKNRLYSTHSEKNDEPILPYRFYCYLDHPTCLVTSGGDPVIERDWSVIAVLPHNQSGRSLWHFLSSADRHLDGTKLLHSIT